MESKKFICAVALKDPALLESILGQTVVKAAWEHIAERMSQEFKELLSRFDDITLIPLGSYQCGGMATVTSAHGHFDEQEQIAAILDTTQSYVYQALVDYFGGGSGRKMEFVLLVKTLDNVALLNAEYVTTCFENEGVSSAFLLEAAGEETSPYCDITKRDFVALLANDQLQTYLQSIVQLQDNRVVGYEVLTRGPRGSQVERADKLFGTASHFGLTKEVELACIIQALQFLPQVPRDLFITLNAGPEVLASDELAALLKQPDIIPYLRQIAFELTEHLPLANLAEVKDAVTRLKTAGIQIFLDDTGCGFFDISTAEALHPSVVKLCISVIRRIDGSEAIRQEICDTRQRLDKLGAITLGEGVEEAFQADFLRSLGVQYAQGYYFDKPAPIDKVLTPKST